MSNFIGQQNGGPQEDDQEKKTPRLSYTPSPSERPIFEALFQKADTTHNGTIITVDEALRVLALSTLSVKKLQMILHMAKNEKTSFLTKGQFYVAVRLVQFRQNREFVRNLTLTVPDHVHLNPPYFKGLEEIESQGRKTNTAKTTDSSRNTEGQVSLKNKDGDTTSKTKDGETEQQSVGSTSFLTSKCVAMEQEISKLKIELKTTVEQLHAVAKDNYNMQREIPQSFNENEKRKQENDNGMNRMKGEGMQVESFPNNSTPKSRAISNPYPEQMIPKDTILTIDHADMCVSVLSDPEIASIPPQPPPTARRRSISDFGEVMARHPSNAKLVHTNPDMNTMPNSPPNIIAGHADPNFAAMPSYPTNAIGNIDRLNSFRNFNDTNNDTGDFPRRYSTITIPRYSSEFSRVSDISASDASSISSHKMPPKRSKSAINVQRNSLNDTSQFVSKSSHHINRTRPNSLLSIFKGKKGQKPGKKQKPSSKTNSDPRKVSK